jgi:hypothetical protein
MKIESLRCLLRAVAQASVEACAQLRRHPELHRITFSVRTEFEGVDLSISSEREVEIVSIQKQ